MVDDETQFRETTRKILEKRDLKPSWPPTAGKPLRSWTAFRNIGMPDMDGNETLEEI